MSKIKVGIMGGAGYTGGELIRLLLNHPDAEIVFVHSKSNAGKKLAEVHTDLVGESDLSFMDSTTETDINFLCVGHGEAKKVLEDIPGLKSARLIDLSQDHRIGDFVYGLPELNWERISKAHCVANPGCFATAIQLALLPLAEKGLLKNTIHVSATTGSTGAGQKFSESSHFSWRQNNLSVYKAFEHQHLAEIQQGIRELQPGFWQDIHFIPQRGSFTRGIFGSMYTACPISENDLRELYAGYYRHAAFVHVSDCDVDLKQVVNTNKCLLSVSAHQDKVLVNFCIDNLLKGASGQAVQNMNLMFGREETMGLKLKASYF